MRELELAMEKSALQFSTGYCPGGDLHVWE